MTWKAPPAEVICCPGGACSFGARPSSVELHRSAPRLTDVRRIAYEPQGRNGSVDFVCRRSRRDAS